VPRPDYVGVTTVAFPCRALDERRIAQLNTNSFFLKPGSVDCYDAGVEPSADLADSTSGPSEASPREIRRQRRHQLGRTQLLDAAEFLFAQNGFQQTTLKEIADLSGFSVGGVYVFFPNKEALFIEVALRRGGDFFAGLERAMDSDDDERACLHAVADFWVGFFREHPYFARIVLRFTADIDDLLGEQDASPILVNVRRLKADLSQLFDRGQSRAVLHGTNAPMMGALFAGVIREFCSMEMAAGQSQPSDLTALHDVIDRAFVCRQGPRSPAGSIRPPRRRK
jgi:AcrR family transcriptional regulator